MWFREGRKVTGLFNVETEIWGRGRRVVTLFDDKRDKGVPLANALRVTVNGGERERLENYHPSHCVPSKAINKRETNIMKFITNKRHSHPTRTGAGRRTGERGFTLVETSIALVILMVAGLGSISLFLFSVNYGSGAADRARALSIAQQRMELVRDTPYDSLDAAFATANTGSVTLGATTTGDPRRFNVTTFIADNTVANTTAGSQKIITISVIPSTNGKWSSGTVILKTYRSSSVRGPN